MPNLCTVEETQFYSRNLYWMKEKREGRQSFVVEFGDLVPQDNLLLDAVFCDGDEVNDTPAGAVPDHGQGDSWRGEEGNKGLNASPQLQLG